MAKPVEYPEELMRIARLKQGLPPTPSLSPDFAHRASSYRPPMPRKVGLLVPVSYDCMGFWRYRCGACGSLRVFASSFLKKRRNPTCGCVPMAPEPPRRRGRPPGRRTEEPYVRPARPSLYLGPKLARVAKPAKHFKPPEPFVLGDTFYRSLDTKLRQLEDLHGRMSGLECIWGHEEVCRAPNKIRDVRRLQDI